MCAVLPFTELAHLSPSPSPSTSPPPQTADDLLLCQEQEIALTGKFVCYPPINARVLCPQAQRSGFTLDNAATSTFPAGSTDRLFLAHKLNSVLRVRLPSADLLPGPQEESLVHVLVGVLRPERGSAADGLWLDVASCELMKPQGSMNTRNTAYLRQRETALLQAHERDYCAENKVRAWAGKNGKGTHGC